MRMGSKGETGETQDDILELSGRYRTKHWSVDVTDERRKDALRRPGRMAAEVFGDILAFYGKPPPSSTTYYHGQRSRILFRMFTSCASHDICLLLQLKSLHHLYSSLPLDKNVLFSTTTTQLTNVRLTMDQESPAPQSGYSLPVPATIFVIASAVLWLLFLITISWFWRTLLDNSAFFTGAVIIATAFTIFSAIAVCCIVWYHRLSSPPRQDVGLGQFREGYSAREAALQRRELHLREKEAAVRGRERSLGVGPAGRASGPQAALAVDLSPMTSVAEMSVPSLNGGNHPLAHGGIVMLNLNPGGQNLPEMEARRYGVSWLS